MFSKVTFSGKVGDWERHQELYKQVKFSGNYSCGELIFSKYSPLNEAHFLLLQVRVLLGFQVSVSLLIDLNTASFFLKDQNYFIIQM